jgi:hypothetical protein
LNIENDRTNKILVRLDDHDLLMSCKAVGGKPAPNVLIIDGQTKANQTQSVQYTLNSTRSYDNKTVTCQASNPAYSQNSLTDSAVIFLYCK